MADPTHGFTIKSPPAPQLSFGFVAGNLSAGVYKYALTYTTGFGETTIGGVSPVNTQDTSTVMIAIPTFPPNVTSVNLYRTKRNGDKLFLRTTLVAPQTYTDGGDDQMLFTRVPPTTHCADSKTIFAGDVAFTGKVTFDNSHSNARGDINSSNVSMLKLSKIGIASSPQSLLSAYGTPASDGINIYFSVTSKHATSATSGITTTTSAPPPNYLVCVSATTQKIIWKRIISSYSGIPGDFTLGAPTIYGNYLLFGSALDIPQTYFPFNNVVNRYTGGPAQTSGSPARMYCVDKNTGELVWESVVGQVAETATSPGNYENITTPPLVFEVNMFPSTQASFQSQLQASFQSQLQASSPILAQSTTPVVVCGTNSCQGKRPWLVCPEGLPHGSSLGSHEDFRFTDVGRVLFLNLHTGEIIAEQSLAQVVPTDVSYPNIRDDRQPTQQLFITAPHTPFSTADFFRAGETSIQVYHYVTAADLAPEGLLDNPAGATFDSKIMWTLSANQLAPAMLIGASFLDNTGAVSVIPEDGLLGDNFDRVVLEIDVQFSPTDATIIYNGTAHPLAGQLLDGTEGLQKARIITPLTPSTSLDDEQAYQCSYFGAGVNGIVYSNGRGTDGTSAHSSQSEPKILVVTGQNEKIPYFESKLFDDATHNYIPSQMSIATAQANYAAAPSSATFAAIEAAYLAADIALDQRLAIPLSVMGERNYADSVVCVDVNSALGIVPSNFGLAGSSSPQRSPILTAYKTSPYDCLHSGYKLDAQRKCIVGTNNVIPGYNDSQRYYGAPYGSESALTQIVEIGPSQFAVSSASGKIFKIEITGVPAQEVPILTARTQIGNAGVNNMTCKGKLIYSVQTNTREPFVSLPPLPPLSATSPQQPFNLPPILDWYAGTGPQVIKYKNGTSYVVGNSAWTRSLGSTSAAIPCAHNDMLYVLTGNGQLQCLDVINGNMITQYDFGGTGQTGPSVVNCVLDSSTSLYCVPSGALPVYLQSTTVSRGGQFLVHLKL